MPRPVPKYTDGSPVQIGDRARYHQAPGGLLPRGSINGDIWNYGTIVRVEDNWGDDHWYPDIHLKVDTGPYAGSTCGLLGHVIERLP